MADPIVPGKPNPVSQIPTPEQEALQPPDYTPFDLAGTLLGRFNPIDIAQKAIVNKIPSQIIARQKSSIIPRISSYFLSSLPAKARMTTLIKLGMGMKDPMEKKLIQVRAKDLSISGNPYTASELKNELRDAFRNVKIVKGKGNKGMITAEVSGFRSSYPLFSTSGMIEEKPKIELVK